MKPFRYVVPTEVHFGAGALAKLAKLAAPLGKKALLVTGACSARVGGILNQVQAQLPGAILFEGVSENPTTTICMDGARLCRGSNCDYIVGLGGGSAMDAAKAIAVLARNPGDCREYLGADKYPEPNLPVIGIPTTAGTGSEVTQYSVLVDVVENNKRTLSGRSLFPTAAIVDPELTVRLPRNITIHTGLDALSQAMEGFVSRRSTPIGDLLALDVCRLVRDWLPVAAHEPRNIDARSRMLYAAMLSGCVIAQSGTTLVHGMGYYFTLDYGMAHGLANALLLAPVFEYNAQFEPEKVAEIAGALGYPARPEVGDAGAQIGRAVRGLLRELGVSPAARDHGVDEGRLLGYAKHIVGDRSRFKNQVGEPGMEEVYGFFRRTWEG